MGSCLVSGPAVPAEVEGAAATPGANQFQHPLTFV